LIKKNLIEDYILIKTSIASELGESLIGEQRFSAELCVTPIAGTKSEFWFDDHIWPAATTGFPIVKINANKQFDGVYHSKTSVRDF
jgi:hypothetical protein